MKKIGSTNNQSGGISYSSHKIGPKNSFAFGRAIDFRTEPTEFTLHSKSQKISGSTVTDLPMSADIACDVLYMYGNTGNVYNVATDDTVVKEYTIPDSQGNGVAYFGEDKYLYLAGNKTISRRSNACTTGSYTEAFLETTGGEPTNTKSLDLEASSSMSATRADTASLSVTGDLTLETYIKPESLPTGSNEMTLMSKWDESGSTRSYKLSIIPVANYFGDGSDGSLTISTNTTNSPTDSACTGTAGTTTLTATNASFATGDIIFIHQSQGTGAGTWERNEIASYTAGTITTVNALSATYTTGAQVVVMPQYTNVTVNSGITLTAKAWNGTTGGILALLANDTFTNNGNILSTAKGFRGGLGKTGFDASQQGEGTNGTGSLLNVPNGNGGSGGNNGTSYTGGGGGGNATVGGSGGGGVKGAFGSTVAGGNISGSSDLTTVTFGGGGGGGAGGFNGGTTANNGSQGGTGGGFLFISAVTINNAGTISSNGSQGTRASLLGGTAYGGSGAGGSNLFKCQTFTNTGTIEALGAALQGSGLEIGGVGGEGRNHVDYLTSYTGTTTPTLSALEDSMLGDSDGYALELSISSDGDNSETYVQNIDNPMGYWNRFSVGFDASESTAYFYKNGESLGTRTGSFTAIDDNASEFALGCYTNSGSSRTGFYDGLMDDARVWNTLRSASQILNNSTKVLLGTENGLVAYYEFEDDVTDSQTSGNNDLTANNSPTYSTDAPFSGVTTRGDEDVSIDGSGQTYTLTTAVNEGATHRQTFTPTKEPIKSLALNINTVGTGNWTIVVHDSLNNEVASVTVANADLLTGVYEFIFSSSFRPVLNAEYHVHAYSSVADGVIVTGTTSDMEAAYLRTYFQILVDDQYHPMTQFINFLVIGNERYLAKLEAGSLYNPHRLILPSGYRVRALAPWGEYIAIGLWRGDAITDSEQGKILFWDGTSDTYVEPLDVPQGAINALFGNQRRLLISAGYRGQVLEYTGGNEARQLFTMPEREKGDKIELAPSSITMWENIHYIGATLDTDSTTVHQGVYSWGRKDDLYDDSLGFDYPLSIGDQTSSLVKIGCLIPRGKKLYIGYQNGNFNGIDIIDNSAAPYTSGTLEMLITDLGRISNTKLPLIFKASFVPLNSGESVSIKYKPDRASSWTTLTTQSTAGANEARVTIHERLREVQFAVDLATTVSTAPTIIDLSLYSDDESEGRII